jgi:hypothetical protein
MLHDQLSCDPARRQAWLMLRAPAMATFAAEGLRAMSEAGQTETLGYAEPLGIASVNRA